MNRKLLMKHCALLLVLAAALWSSSALALTINVNVTGSQAPYVYAWDNAQTPLTDAYPGTQLTNIKKVGGKTWYYIDLDATSVNVILSFGTDATKTIDITDIAGNRYFEFANNNANNVTDYYDLPEGASYEGQPFTYLVNTKGWTTVKAYVWGNGEQNAAFPGVAMEEVGINGNGNKVYKWTGNVPSSPTNVIFTNDIEQSSDLTWKNGAVWSNHAYDYQMAIAGAALNATDFPDENLRKAISASINVQEGQTFITDNVRILDISYDANKGMTGKITNPTGIEKLTALEELYARDNSLTHLDLTHTTTLRVLDVSGNDVLKGMRGVSYCNANDNGVNVKGNNNFKKLVADNCPAWVFNAGLGSGNTNYQYITSLEYISQKNNPLDGWSSGFTAQTNLKYLDLTNTGQNANHSTQSSRISVTALTQLETLILADNPNLGSVPGIKTCTKLQYIDLNNCGLTSSALGATNFETTGGSNLKYLDVSNNPALYNLSFTGKTNLEVLKMNNCTAYDWGTLENSPNLKHIEFSGCTGMIASMWNHLNGTNHTKLQYLNLSNGTTSVSGHAINFPSLDSLIVTNHNTITELNITGHCPGYIDVTNSTPSSSQLRVMAITNCGISTMPREIIGLMSNPKLYRFDLTSNQFETVPEIACPSLTTMVMNNNLLTNIDAPSNVRYLYAQHNNFPTGEYVLETSLYGVDLGNNGFTKFKAVGNGNRNPNLKALALGNSPSLTEIELHENPLLTQTSPDGVIESDNGLYIRGLSNLKVLNIENSSFNKLGQQNSLEGVTGLTKLQARHNEFTTFTNGVYALDVAGNANYRIPDPTESSLEHLTALEYLDLAYNNLQDSVHLYRNVALKHLDVSHNNEIHGVFDGTIDPNDAAAVEAMKVKKGYNFMKYGRVYGKDPNNPNAKPMPGWNPSDAEWTAGYTNLQAQRERPFDLRIEDLNDTTGLYHLDLGKNVNLEWLDISYTNIHNTSAGPTHMNPGWMDKDWVTDMGTFMGKPSPNTTTHRAYSSWHTFVYFIPCSNLKVIHADHNNMRSLGIRYFPELDTLTCSYMYGDSEIMRDFSGSGDLRYNMGNTGVSTTIKKFDYVNWNKLDKDGYPTIVLIGPNNTEASTDVYPNKLRYWDLSYSGFNEVRLYPGAASPDLPYLEYVNVSGNPLNFQVHPNSDVSNYNSLDVTYCPNIRTVLAENCADLPVVRAHNRTKLDTLYLSNDANLKTLYVQNDPVLKTNFQGLSTLTGLETLFGYNNTQWRNDITFASNNALKNLWISNIGASQLNVAANTALEKLRAYDNSLRTLDLSNNTALAWLDVARNKLREIDLSGNTKLQFFNISNGSDTRAQLNGTEALNHDGSDGDGDKPTTVFSENDTPIVDENTGNSLSDLALPASIIDARANGNDLHCIKPVQGGSFTNLANIEFAHNHINGIDLSDAPSATVESHDNGRTIVADFATFKVKDNNNQIQEYKVYFFQLENLEEPNGTILTDKESKDLKLASRHLGDDGLALNKISGWDSENSGMLKSGTTVTPSNMDDILDPDQIPGKIVVLVPEDVNESTNEASGHATYTYTTGAGSEGSEFYLNWTSNGTVTGVNIVGMPLDNVSITNTYGNLTVTGADGTVVGVYDLNGRQVASETISGGSVTIEGLTPGIYVVNGQKVLLK